MTSCDACGDTFPNLMEYHVHQDFHLKKSTQVKCILCPGSFRKVFHYVNHVLNKHLHHEHLRYCCIVCDAMFFSLVPLYHHARRDHPNDKIFQCLTCGHHSETLALLKTHKRKHDFDTEHEEFSEFYATMKPRRDDVMLDAPAEMKMEDGTVVAERDGQFRKWSDYKLNCSLCSKGAMTPIEYFQHHENEHIDWTGYVPGKIVPLKNLACQECPGTSFGAIVSFYSHITHKHKYKDLSFRCIVCAELYWNFVDLSHHLQFRHPTFRHFLCMICGKLLDRFSVFKHHMTAIHAKADSEVLPQKRRKNLKIRLEKSKRSKVKRETSESDLSSEESQNELTEDSSSEDQVSKTRREKKTKKSKKVEAPKRRPNNRHRPERQNIFGPEIDTPEKLFADEIAGKSIFTSELRLNISEQVNLPDGEVSEELANVQGVNPLRWKDLLMCAVCKIKFTSITNLTQHITGSHGVRTRAFGCFNCEIEYGALYESSLVNHLAERHYFEHLKLCCLICSKLFYDFLSLVNHYKTHNGEFEILVCFICGFYAKTLDDLKEHKAYHIQMETTKPDNQKLCEKVLDKFTQGIEANAINIAVAEYERNADGSVTIECQRRFTVDWGFAQYQCPRCFDDLTNPFELFAHLRLKHPKEQEHARKIYSCNGIGCAEKKEFSGMHYFYNHAAEFHFDSLKFTCVVCSRLFWNYLALANHYKNIHRSFTAVFCCHCGKLFHSITSGAIHYKKIMIMLTDEEKKMKKEGKLETEASSHICHVCGKCCKNSYTLVKHITTHEEPDPAKMLRCNICSKM